MRSIVARSCVDRDRRPGQRPPADTQDPVTTILPGESRSRITAAEQAMETKREQTPARALNSRGASPQRRCRGHRRLSSTRATHHIDASEALSWSVLRRLRGRSARRQTSAAFKVPSVAPAAIAGPRRTKTAFFFFSKRWSGPVWTLDRTRSGLVPGIPNERPGRPAAPAGGSAWLRPAESKPS